MANKRNLGELSSIKRDSLNAVSGTFVDTLLSNIDNLIEDVRSLKDFRNIARDSQVQSAFQQRRLSVVQSEWQVDAGGDRAIDKRAAEAMRAELKKIDFDRVTDLMLYSRFYGYAVAELVKGYTSDGKISLAAPPYQYKGNKIVPGVKVREPWRFAFNVDGDLYLLNDDGQSETKMPHDQFWVVRSGGDNSDDIYGRGLAHYCYWPVVYKKHGWRFWTSYLERQGRPIPKIEMPNVAFNDSENIDFARTLLKNAAEGGELMIPEGWDLDLLATSVNNVGNYEEYSHVMDLAISKLILSQTMTTDSGASRSQAEVHQGVADKVVKADADLICSSWNNGPGLWLTRYNFPNAEPPNVWRVTSPQEDLNKRAERDERIIKLGYKPTPEYIQEIYGEGWVEAEQPSEEPASQPNFAEPSAVVRQKNLHRADQEGIYQGAKHMAEGDAMAEEIRYLLAEADESEDYADFMERLLSLAKKGPSDDTINKFRQAGLASRLLGFFRGQR